MEELTVTDLSPQAVDWVTAALKGGLGAVPFVGGALAEGAGSIIPHQRMDRLVEFAKQLSVQLSEVERTLALPVIQALLVAPNDPDLCQMFARLLATAMNEETSYQARPAFSDVLRQITPDEARLIKYLSSDEINMSVYSIYSTGLAEPTFVSDNLWPALYHAGVVYDRRIPSYVDNLVRLGLLTRPVATDRPPIALKVATLGPGSFNVALPVVANISDMDLVEGAVETAVEWAHTRVDIGDVEFQNEVDEIKRLFTTLAKAKEDITNLWSYNAMFMLPYQVQNEDVDVFREFARWTSFGQEFIDVCLADGSLP